MTKSLNLPALRTFVSVAATGSLSRTAASLGVAQSAVSRHIAQLESELGGPLFHRTGRGVVATDLATAMLDSAQSVLAALDGMVAQASERAGAPSGTVSIGLLHGISGVLPSRLHAHLRERFPLVRLKMIEGHSGEIEDWIAGGQVSIGILNRYRPGKWPGAQRLFSSPVCLVGRPGSLKGVPGSIGFRAMAKYPLVVPVRPNSLRARLDELAQRADIELNVAVEASGNTTLKSLVADHDLFGIMPHHACARDLRLGTLQAVRIDERGLQAAVLLVASAHHPMTKAAREVLRAIPPIARSLVKAGVWIEIA